MIRLHLVAALLALLPAAAQQPRKTAVFVKVFSGITTAQTSSALPNIGQSMHLLTVIFPGEATAVSPIQVRIEASFDGTTYFPISADIVRADAIGGLVYQVEKAYAPWPYVRVRSLVATPGKPMTIHYAGHLVPVVPFIQKLIDRFVL